MINHNSVLKHSKILLYVILIPINLQGVIVKIEDLKFDERLKTKLINDGIYELYPPQAEAVEKGLLESVNQVVAIPTASGKTLIAIMAIFSSLLKNGGKAIYLAPLRALASEKYTEFKEFADLVGLSVAISTGDLDEQSGWIKNANIIIATNEKFDSIIRHQVDWLNDIRVVVSDEVHLINDASRGPVLEVVLSLIRRNLPECQIIALSATINNADEIAEWLEAELILSTWRPVDLKEGVWENGTVTYANGKKKQLGDPRDKTGYISLTTDMISQNGQVLVFANTRKSTVKTAMDLKSKVKSLINNNQLGKLREIANQIRSTGEKTELRTKLAEVVECGVAFHHAGLVSRHRKIVEQAFKDRIIKVITASPTLAAGVNIPGRRVVIRNVTRYSQGYIQPIPVLEYKQMAGRAGRPQYDPYGEAIILAKNSSEKNQYLDRFVRADTELIYSKLGTEPAMRSHILSFIASEYVNDFDTAMDMIANTFYGYQNEDALFLVEEEIFKVFEILTESKLISKDEPYQITPFGKRVNELYLDPLSARLIKVGLEESIDRDKLADIIYLQLLSNTPDLRSYSVRQKEMDILIDTYNKYEDDWININHETDYEEDIFFSSLKIAKTLDMWLNEKSEEEINNTFGIASGDLHSLLNRMAWLVHSANEIARIFDWKYHKKALSRINKRIKYGIRADLLPLVELSNVGRVRARTLYDAGYTNIEKIKNADEKQLAKLQGIGARLAKLIIDNLTVDDTNDTFIENIPDKTQTTLDAFFE